MRLSDFDYDLPEGYIAQQPAYPRDNSKLLVLDKGSMHVKRFHDIIDYVREGDVFVINSSRVSYSKLVGKKETGGPAELVIECRDRDSYTCKVKAKNPHVGCRLLFCQGLKAELVARKGSSFIVRFNKGYSWIRKQLELPLPPYINSKVDDEDYQTVYSKEEGSVAAPTAGLHFTPGLIASIQEKGVRFAEVCLHVGYSTFIGVREKDPRNHVMEKERFSIRPRDADIINKRRSRLFVVGTTSLRSLESAADDKGRIIPGEYETGLFIYPGYTFKILPEFFITNFHLPRTTLLMLVSAIAGRKRLLDAYELAKEEGFRFYSLGDAMMIADQ